MHKDDGERVKVPAGDGLGWVRRFDDLHAKNLASELASEPADFQSKSTSFHTVDTTIALGAIFHSLLTDTES
jgi:hypothetical protein